MVGDDCPVRFGEGYLMLEHIYLLELLRQGSTLQPVLGYVNPTASPPHMHMSATSTFEVTQGITEALSAKHGSYLQGPSAYELDSTSTTQSLFPVWL